MRKTGDYFYNLLLQRRRLMSLARSCILKFGKHFHFEDYVLILVRSVFTFHIYGNIWKVLVSLAKKFFFYC
jgi:hypothetical protein